MRTIVIAFCALGSQAAFAQDAGPSDIPQANVAAVLEGAAAQASIARTRSEGRRPVASDSGAVIGGSAS